MIYTYRCNAGHISERKFPIGMATGTAPCEPGCAMTAQRDILADLQSVQFMNTDPFRRAWLSPRTQRALQNQGRPMDPLAPKDKFEKRHVERATGRVYIGDDTDSLRPATQRAIAAAEEKRRQKDVA